jgi:nickel-dependent lactate racemase
VVIIVNDVTRPTPCEYILPPILNVLGEQGVKKEQITLLVATGLHKPNTIEQNLEIFGEEILRNYKLIFHKADESELVDYGELQSKNHLYVNKIATEADFLITIGVILPHYMAGFSGGRKSILPGVSGRETIQKNHSQLVDLMDNLPPLKENPVNLEMIEAARKVGVDFIVNVVTNSDGEIVKVVSGDLEEAWYLGTDQSSLMYEVPLDGLVDVAIVSANGYPRDINLYQSQKALDHADRATRNGGTIILVAECIDGLGEPVFEKWMNEANTPDEIIERIKNQFVMGGHKAFGIAKVAKNKRILLVSSLNEDTTALLFSKKCFSLDEALSEVKKYYGDQFSCVVMPQGSLTVPVLKRERF